MTRCTCRSTCSVSTSRRDRTQPTPTAPIGWCRRPSTEADGGQTLLQWRDYPAPACGRRSPWSSATTPLARPRAEPAERVAGRRGARETSLVPRRCGRLSERPLLREKVATVGKYFGHQPRYSQQEAEAQAKAAIDAAVEQGRPPDEEWNALGSRMGEISRELATRPPVDVIPPPPPRRSESERAAPRRPRVMSEILQPRPIPEPESAAPRGRIRPPSAAPAAAPAKRVMRTSEPAPSPAKRATTARAGSAPAKRVAKASPSSAAAPVKRSAAAKDPQRPAPTKRPAVKKRPG